MDPNEVVGTPSERQIWLAPDWSKRGSTAAIAGPGASQVWTRTVTYRDGRVITYVLDENHNPITHQALSEDVDPTLKEAWDKNKAQINAQAGVTKPTNVYVGTNPATGKPSQVSEWPDGHKSYDDTQVPASQAGNTDWHTEGTPQPDGSFNNAQPIMVRTVNGQRQTRQLTSAELKDWNEAAQRARNPGGKTDAEIQAQQTATDRKPDPDHPGYFVVTTKNPQTQQTETHYENAANQTVPTPPGKSTTKTEDVPVNGVHYTRVSTIDADGKTASVSYLGPDGKPVAALPSEGQSTAGGPSMPTIVVGATADALRQYQQLLQNDPNLTPLEREKRLQEAIQIGQVASQDAATQQRDRESQRNAAYNTASTKLTFMQNGTKDALQFVSSLIGNLPAGSTLGGQAFAALMGMNALQMQRSGINSLPSVGPQQPAPTVTAKDLGDRSALSTINAQLSAQLAQQAAQHAGQALPANGQPAPANSQPAPSGGPAEPPARAAIPAQPASVAPASTATTLPPGRPDQTQVGSQIDNAISPPPGSSGNEQPTDILTLTTANGQTFQRTRADYDAWAPDQKGAVQVVNAEAAARQRPASPPAGTPTYGKPSTSFMPSGDPNDPLNQHPDGSVLPDPNTTPSQMPVNVPYPSDAGAESKANTSDWAALAGLGQPVPPGSSGGDPSSMAGSPAMLRAMAASTPPWRISEEQYNAMKAAGIPDDVIFSVPGRAAA